MLPVVGIRKGLRQEGLGFGLPMVFIDLDYSGSVDPEEILEEALSKIGRRGWICIKGEPDPLSCGMGTLVKGFSKLQRYVEVETDGLHRDPSWTRAVDRWVVDFQEKPAFNYNALRASDTIRFKARSLDVAKDVLDRTTKTSCAKYLVLPKDLSEAEDSKFLDLAGGYERVRLYKC